METSQTVVSVVKSLYTMSYKQDSEGFSYYSAVDLCMLALSVIVSIFMNLLLKHIESD